MTHRTTYRITRLRTAALAAGLAVALCGAAGAAGAAVAGSATASGPAAARPLVSADSATAVVTPSTDDWNSTGS